MLSAINPTFVHLPDSPRDFLKVWNCSGRARNIFAALPGKGFKLDQDGVPDISPLRIDPPSLERELQAEVSGLVRETLNLSTPLAVLMNEENRRAYLNEAVGFNTNNYSSNDELIEFLERWLNKAPGEEIEKRKPVKKDPFNPVPQNPIGESADNEDQEPTEIGTQMSEEGAKALGEYYKANGERRRAREYTPHLDKFALTHLFQLHPTYRITTFSANNHGLRDEDKNVRMEACRLMKKEAESICLKYVEAQRKRINSNKPVAHSSLFYHLDSNYIEDTNQNLKLIVNALTGDGYYGIRDTSPEVRLETLDTLDLIAKFAVMQFNFLNSKEHPEPSATECSEILLSIYNAASRATDKVESDDVFYKELSTKGAQIESFAIDGLKTITPFISTRVDNTRKPSLN